MTTEQISIALEVVGFFMVTIELYGEGRLSLAHHAICQGSLKPARAGHFKTGHAEGLHLGRR